MDHHRGSGGFSNPGFPPLNTPLLTRVLLNIDCSTRYVSTTLVTTLFVTRKSTASTRHVTRIFLLLRGKESKYEICHRPSITVCYIYTHTRVTENVCTIIVLSPSKRSRTLECNLTFWRKNFRGGYNRPQEIPLLLLNGCTQNIPIFLRFISMVM